MVECERKKLERELREIFALVLEATVEGVVDKATADESVVSRACWAIVYLIADEKLSEKGE